LARRRRRGCGGGARAGDRGGGGKDNAVSALLGTDGYRTALYAGDDRTDLDAFRRLRYLQEQGELDAAICVGVTSEEGPREIGEEADLRVDGPAGWLQMLESLAG
jgi:trehalose 6-phosphate phosphatase